jgi:hypothetical protein
MISFTISECMCKKFRFTVSVTNADSTGKSSQHTSKSQYKETKKIVFKMGEIKAFMLHVNFFIVGLSSVFWI